jgi:ureidoglycolate lyase
VSRHLRPRPLTPDAFAPYGTVIETRGRAGEPANAGTAERFRLAVVEHHGQAGTGISIFRSRRPPGAVRAHVLERHPLGTQAFVPLQRRAWLVVVAADPGTEPVCFRARGDQGVQYGTGVWHHPLLVLAAEQDFLVVDRLGPEPNLEAAAIDPAFEIRGA